MNRLQYIDIYKGLLILMVVFVHLPQIGISLLNLDSSYLVILDNNKYIIGSFYMPAFFFLTGYCSNFSISFNSFFKKNLKNILLPAIAFSVIIRGAEQILEINEEIASYQLMNYIALILKCGSFWFLKSLFLSKTILWFLRNQIKNEYVILFIVVIMSLFGTIVFQIANFIDRYNVIQSFLLMPAIAMGAFVKSKLIQFSTPVFFVCFVLFIVVTVLHILFQLPIPIVAQGIIISSKSFVSYLILSFLGIFSFLFISKLINKNIFFEKIGKSSIVIYMVSNLLMFLCEKYLCIYVYPDSVTNVFLFYSITLIFAILGCLIIEKVLLSTWLRVLLGKF